MARKNRKSPDEVVDVNGTKVFIESGEVKTILSEAIQKANGDMTVEQLREIIKAEVKMIYTMNDKHEVVDING